jgi:hypothetical protein
LPGCCSSYTASCTPFSSGGKDSGMSPHTPSPDAALCPPTLPQVLREIPEFTSDVAHLDGMDFAGELGSDYVLAARVNLSK